MKEQTLPELGERLESCEDDRIDMKELENLGVDLVRSDLALPQTRVHPTYSDDELEEQTLQIKNHNLALDADRQGGFQSSPARYISPAFMGSSPIKHRYKGKRVDNANYRKKVALRQ